MKYLIPKAVLFTTLFVTACVPCFAGPFGFNRGMTEPQIISIVGASHVVKESKSPGGELILEINTAPTPYPMFERYDLAISPSQGLLKIVAIGKDIQTSSDGFDLRQKYNEIKHLLSLSYGNPSHELDFLMPDSIWSNPGDFMIGLLKKDRVLTCEWKSSSPKMVESSINIVGLTAIAENSDTGYLTLEYEFEGWDAYLDSVKAKEATAF